MHSVASSSRRVVLDDTCARGAQQRSPLLLPLLAVLWVCVLVKEDSSGVCPLQFEKKRPPSPFIPPPFPSCPSHSPSCTRHRYPPCRHPTSIRLFHNASHPSLFPLPPFPLSSSSLFFILSFIPLPLLPSSLYFSPPSSFPFFPRWTPRWRQQRRACSSCCKGTGPGPLTLPSSTPTSALSLPSHLFTSNSSLPLFPSCPPDRRASGSCRGEPAAAATRGGARDL